MKLLSPILSLVFSVLVGPLFAQSSYNMPTSGTTTQTICSGTIYDSGGSGNYSNNNRGFLRLRPSTSGAKVSLNFSSNFYLDVNDDFLFIYDGGTTSSTLIGRYTGGNGPSTITATNSSGELLLYFFSDRSGNFRGFEATASCTNLPCNPGQIASSRINICKGDTATLKLENFSPGSLLQWQGSTDGTTWSNIIGANDSTYFVPKNSSFSFFRTVVICSGATTGSAVSNAVQLTNYTLGVSVADSIFCGPDSVAITASVSGLIDEIEEDFDPIDNSLWDNNSGFTSSSGCGSVTGNALQMRGSGSRLLESRSLDLTGGGTVEYQVRAGTSSFGSCENIDGTSEWIRFEYSTNNGSSWTLVRSHSSTSGFDFFTWDIPSSAQTTNTKIRWRQPSNSGTCCDHWALDDIKITASTTGDFVFDWFPKSSFNDSTSKRTYANFTQSQQFGVVITDTVSQCSDTAYSKVRVALSDVDFNVPDTLVLEDTAFFNNTSVLDDKNVSYSWNFGDGNTATTSNPKHLYQRTGTYSVSLVVNASGCIDSVRKNVIVRKKPILDFLVSTGCEGDPLNFTNTTLEAGLVDTFVWLFGDGGRATGTNPIYVYNSSGTFNIQMIAKRRYGYSDTVSRQITLLPGVDADFTVGNACEQEDVVFQDNSTVSRGFVSFIDYDFNSDGVYDSTFLAANSNVSKRYNTNGNYTVVIRATTNLGCVDTTHKTFSVFEKPNAFFSAQTKCLGEQVLIEDRSTIGAGSISSLEYDFDLDGNYDSTVVGGTDLNFVFTAGQNTIFKLRATSNQGCSNTYNGQINTIATPIANFSTLSECVGDPIVFQDVTSLNGTTLDSITYDFDQDNAVDTTLKQVGQNVRFTYATTGSKPVTMIVRAANGCNDTITKTLDVSVKPVVDLSLTEACEGDATIFTDKSTISNGSIISVDLDFDNDGTFDRTGLANGGTVSHTYPSAGNKNINIRATSNKGCVTEQVKSLGVSKTVTVNPNPEPGFTATFECFGNPTEFEDTTSVSTGSITEVQYDLDGDGVFDTTFNSSGKKFSYQYVQEGQYDVNVLAETDKSCIDLYTKRVTVKANPVPEFVIDNRCAGETTTVVDLSSGGTGSISRIDYDFDNDGAFDTIGVDPGDTAFYNYTTFGSQTIVIRATTNQGCVNTASETFNFNSKPQADFSFNSVCEGSQTNFNDSSSISSGTISSFRWFFGDGGRSQLKNPSTRYAQIGNYNVDLIVESDAGCKDTASKQVTVRPRPSVKFSTTNVCLDNEASFTNNSNINTGVLSHLWDFGDGATTTAVNPQHKYSSATTYNVKLVSTSNFGCADSAIQNVTIYPEPVAQFAANGVCEGNSIIFRNTSFGASAFDWNFGGGNTSNQTNPSYLFASDGIFNIELIASNSFNCVDTFNDNIEVFEKPSANFAVTDVCKSDTSEFLNTSTGARFYQWSLGDGSFSASQNTDKVYSANGNYRVSLIARSDKNCADTIVKNHEVLALPQVQFSGQEICAYDSISLTNQSTNAVSYQWKLGDGSSSTASNLKYKYASRGDYKVTLIATSVDNCVDSTSTVITVHEVPDANFSFANVCDGETMNFTNTSTISQGNLLYVWEFGDGSGFSLNNTANYKYASSGSYDVSLVAQSNQNCRDTVVKTVQVYGNPVARFSTNNDCLDEAISFANNSSSNSSSYSWNFGDGGTSTATSPNKFYSVAGNYQVTLEATTANGCKDETDTTVIVYPKPTANFTKTNVCLGESSEFTNFSTGASSFDYTFDGFGTSTRNNPSFIFPSVGRFDVELIATTSFGCKDTATRVAVVWKLPEAKASATSVCIDDTVSFVNTSDDASKYEWSFGDGTSSRKENPTHLYPRSGTYDYELVAISNRGCSDTLISNVQVYPKPIANFSTQNECLYDSVGFVNLTTGATTYSWNYGGGSQSFVSSGNHSFKYSADGSYDVKLVASSAQGCSDSIVKTVEVYLPPTAEFSVADNCLNEITSFTNTSSNDAIGFEWSFGDGASSVLRSPGYRYQQPNDFNIQLVAIDQYGCQDTTTNSVTINPLPTADFNVDESCLESATQFSSTSSVSSGAVSSYEWMLGDGSVNTNENFNYTYQEEGQYRVELAVETDKGCTDQTSKLIQVYALPQVSFAASAVCFGNTTEFFETINSKGVIDSIQWSFGDGSSDEGSSPDHIYGAPNDYNTTVRVVTVEGCEDIFSRNVTVLEKPTADFSASEACFTEVTSFTNQSALADRYNWNFGDGNGFSLNTNPTYQYVNPGTYSVLLVSSNNNGCVDSVSKTITVFENPTANFDIENVCLGEEVVVADNSTDAVDYRWNFGDGTIINTENASHLYGESGSYDIWLTVESAESCLDSVERSVEIYTLPSLSISADTMISKGESVKLEVSGAVRYSWSPAEGLNKTTGKNVIATPLSTTNYFVEGFSEFNCKSDTSMTITVNEDYFLEVATLFTPDNNGQNEVWEITNIEVYENCAVTVFDKRGRVVFTSNNYQNSWDGTLNGNPLPDDTYYYLINCNNGERIYKGTVAILRNNN